MLPISLEAATERMMRAGSVAREEAVFGNDFVEHFGGTRQHEVRLWNEAGSFFAGVWGNLGCLCDGVCWNRVVGGDLELEAGEAAVGDLL